MPKVRVPFPTALGAMITNQNDLPTLEWARTTTSLKTIECRKTLRVSGDDLEWARARYAAECRLRKHAGAVPGASTVEAVVVHDSNVALTNQPKAQLTSKGVFQIAFIATVTAICAVAALVAGT